MVNNRGMEKNLVDHAAVIRKICDQLVEKNCFLLTFDYRNDEEFAREIREISLEAGKHYTANSEIDPAWVGYSHSQNGFELQNAGWLSIFEQSDSNQVAAMQMQAYIRTAYPKVLTAIANSVERICRVEDEKTLSVTGYKSPVCFAMQEIQTPEEQPGKIRFMYEGYISLMQGLKENDTCPLKWSACVMMSEQELVNFDSLLTRTVKTTADNFSSALSDLRLAVFSYIAGEDLPSYYLTTGLLGNIMKNNTGGRST